jgi:hypothetical protein
MIVLGLTPGAGRTSTMRVGSWISKLQADDALHRQISARTDLLTMDDMPPRGG